MEVETELLEATGLTSMEYIVANKGKPASHKVVLRWSSPAHVPKFIHTNTLLAPYLKQSS